jgi:hypothetical protein
MHESEGEGGKQKKIEFFQPPPPTAKRKLKIFQPPRPKPESFVAAAAERQKKIEIFEPPPPIKASAYTSTHA